MENGAYKGVKHERVEKDDEVQRMMATFDKLKLTELGNVSRL